MQGRPDTCSVLVNCSEKGRYRLQTATYVNGTEGKHLPLSVHYSMASSPYPYVSNCPNCVMRKRRTFYALPGGKVIADRLC